MAARRARPVVAVAVRLAVVVGPLLLALVAGLAAAVWFPPHRLGLPVWLWLVAVVLVTSGALFACSHWLRRLAPLPALLRLSLVLPDDVPHRFSLARQRWSPAALKGTSAEDGPGRRLLALVGTLAAHDDRTRAHGERVQAYAALIGREMGLSAEDVDRLSWVALLHDVGKVHVPVEVINKNGRPSQEEWAQLQTHPHHGGELVEPLRGWLGDWLDGVEQHHERWDGRGYPRALAGEDISLAARIIAVADTYDVITSARAYKKPMTAEQARAEVTRCAGEQFDPAVVRALLGVGLGKLRRVAGPATLLAALPFGAAAPASAATGTTTAATTAASAATSAVGSAASSVAASVASAVGAHATAAVVAAVVGVGGAVAAVEAADAPAFAATASATSAAAAGSEDGSHGSAGLVGAVLAGLRGGDGGHDEQVAAAGGAGQPSGPALDGAAADPSASAAATPGAEATAGGGEPTPVAAPTPVTAAASPTAASTAPAAAARLGSSTPTSPTGASPSGTSASLPGVSLPGVSLPPVSVPSVSVPPVSVPSVSVPPVSVPGVTLPPISVPGVSVPAVTVPPVRVPPISVPTSLPTGLPGLSVLPRTSPSASTSAPASSSSAPSNPLNSLLGR